MSEVLQKQSTFPDVKEGELGSVENPFSRPGWKGDTVIKAFDHSVNEGVKFCFVISGVSFRINPKGIVDYPNNALGQVQDEDGSKLKEAKELFIEAMQNRNNLIKTVGGDL